MMIICKRSVPSNNHLKEASPSRWLFAKGWPIRIIICKMSALPDDHLHLSFVIVCRCLSLFVVICCCLLFVVVWLLSLYVYCRFLLFVVCRLSLFVYCCLSFVIVCRLSLFVVCHCLSFVVVCRLWLFVVCCCLLFVVFCCCLSFVVFCCCLMFVIICCLSFVIFVVNVTRQNCCLTIWKWLVELTNSVSVPVTVSQYQMTRSK